MQQIYTDLKGKSSDLSQLQTLTDTCYEVTDIV